MKHSPENQSPSRSRDQMTDNKRDETSAGNAALEGESGFIGRWARRKHDALVDVQEPPADDPLVEATDHALQGEAASSDLSSSAEGAEPVLTDVDMPDIETLNADSDFSPFFSKGVSKELRNLALKKLFFSGKFSARDGLDDYDDDFTKFEPLGDTVTSDMKFHARRKEKARLAALEEEKLKLEAAQSEDEEALAEVQAPDEATDQEAKSVESQSTTDTDPAEIASVEDTSQDDQANRDAASPQSIDGIENNIAEESVTQAVSPKDKQPHV